MKDQINGPVGIIIIVVIVLVILVGGYMMFLKGPSEVSPEDTRKAMQGGQGQQNAAPRGAPIGASGR